MTVYLAPVLAAAALVLLAALIGAIAAWRQVDRTNASLSLRCAHQKRRIRTLRRENTDQDGQIRSLRAENTLLGQACDRLTAERDQLAAKREARLPMWGRKTLLDIARATSPADFDRKDNR